MGYYLRVLAERTDKIPASEIQGWLLSAGFPLSVFVVAGDTKTWDQITIGRAAQKVMVTIERDDVEPNSLGEQEIHEFLEELEDCKPATAAIWLKNYLEKVRVIYAFQILFGDESEQKWEPVHLVQNKLRETLGGVSQADSEGFTNTQGYQIVWQFSDDVKGTWKMAVLDGKSDWLGFEMDLGNFKHRRAFMQGKVPKGIVAHRFV